MTVSPYSSTHRLVEVGGRRLLKQLAAGARMQRASGRPDWLDDPTREPAAYRRVLGPLGIGPRCDDSGPDWVLLERLPAPMLWQIGDFEVWLSVAAWVGRLHRVLAEARVDGVPVVEMDASTFTSWRARAASAGAPSCVLDAHEHAARQLLALPAAIFHGDLYPSNLLVDAGPPLTVWPVDWELIGRGPAVLDIAALSSGRWTDAQRRALVDAYAESVEPRLRHDVEEAVDAARLHVCVQWLGTTPRWTAPPDHAHDWMSEALHLAAGR